MKNSTPVFFGTNGSTKFVNPKTAIAKKCAEGLVDKACTFKYGKKVVHNVASLVTGKSLTGAAAQSVAKKTLRSNVVVNSAMFMVETIPDAYKTCNGKMSGTQFAKKTGARAAGMGGCAAGSVWGASVGTALCPGIGTAVGGFVGGVIGSISASSMFKRIL